MEIKCTLGTALYRLFRPVARIGLRHGLAVRDVIDILKCAYVDVACEEYGLRSRPASKARIATLTGLTRAEVARLVARDRRGVEQTGSNHPLHRLVERWLSEPRWQDADGDPAVLNIDDDHGFTALVRAHGGDIPWQTLLRELERLRIASREGNRVQLRQRGFIPVGDDEAAGLPFIGEDAAALLDTLDHNLHAGGKPRYFQRKVVFPGLTETGLELLHNRAACDGQALLETLDQELKLHTCSPQDPSGRLTGLGVYVFDLQKPEGERL
ncbi:MAG: DUF6502 family protein [Salinisphaera sp.]|nr:DUF6502 family protein [Salinisphaera sp.]